MQIHSRNFGLDLARAVAITLVLFAHFAKVIEHLGLWGVELFFGLSGYLIGQILWRNFNNSRNWSFRLIKNFWSRRWWRTLPNYYLFCIVMLGFHYLLGDVLPGIFQFIKVLLFSQDLFSRYEDFFGVSWSLCIEEWFYFTFPLALFISSRFIPSKKVAFVSIIFVYIIGSFLIRQYYIGQGVGHSLRGITIARLDSICYGVAASFFFSGKTVAYKQKLLAFIAGAILLLIAFYRVYFSGIAYEEVKGTQLVLMIVPMGFALTLPLLTYLRAPSGIFTFVQVAVEKLSLWAYSLYLCHIPVIFFSYYICQPIRHNAIGNVASKGIGIGITLLISSIIYKYFELPLTNMRPKEIKEKTAKPVAVIS